MAFDGRIFRSAVEAQQYYRSYKAGEISEDVIQGRVFKVLEERHPDLDQNAVDKAIGACWNDIETLPPDQALDALAEAAGGPPHGKAGVWHATPLTPETPKHHPGSPPLPLGDRPSLSDIIKQRRGVRDWHSRETAPAMFARRKADAPLEAARRELAYTERNKDEAQQEASRLRTELDSRKRQKTA